MPERTSYKIDEVNKSYNIIFYELLLEWSRDDSQILPNQV